MVGAASLTDCQRIRQKKTRLRPIADGQSSEFVYQNVLQKPIPLGFTVIGHGFCDTPLTLAVPVPHENALTHRAVSLVWNRHPQKFGQLDHLLERITTKGITSVSEFSSVVNNLN